MAQTTPTHQITVSYEFTYERTIPYPTTEDIDLDLSLPDREQHEMDEYGDAAQILAKALLEGDGSLTITATNRAV
jgi:hypothetical protein